MKFFFFFKDLSKLESCCLCEKVCEKRNAQMTMTTWRLAAANEKRHNRVTAAIDLQSAWRRPPSRNAHSQSANGVTTPREGQRNPLFSCGVIFSNTPVTSELFIKRLIIKTCTFGRETPARKSRRERERGERGGGGSPRETHARTHTHTFSL